MSDSTIHALAGAGGGILSMAITYPLITLSTKSQVSTNSKPKTQLALMKQIIATQGISGLYAGFESAIVGIALTQGIYYYHYEGLKKVLVQRGWKGVGLSMVNGGIAGAVTAFLTNPIWVLNTRLLTRDPKSKSSIITTGLEVYKEDGIIGFWRGVGPALILVSNPIIQYTVFERLKAIITKKWGDITAFQFFLIGAVSKLCATGLTYPYIVLKSRMHVSKSKETTSDNSASIVSFIHAIIKNEGVAGLYKGIQSKLAQSVLTSALMFTFKEELYKVAVGLLVLLKAQ